jgi:hypothetical protein
MLTMKKYIQKIIITCLSVSLLVSAAYGAQHSKKVEWKAFDASAGGEFDFSFGKYNISIKPGEHATSPFREDNLTMIIKKGNDTIIKHDFVSSYGRGKILIKSGYIFLEYGVGRGTGVREEHIKAFTLLAQYEYIKEPVEVFDVQKSYRFPNPKPVAYPAYVEYKVRFVEDKDNLKVILYGGEKEFGIPEKKEILLEKLVND